MREVARRIERAGVADCPVVIWGEEGSGKRLVAEMIHRLSRRGRGPLVVVSAEDVPEDDGEGRFLEEQLFGTSMHAGRLVEAEGGTLVIDEITELPPTSQARLLGAAEGRNVSSPRHASEVPLDFRLIATTKFDLAESVRRGTLREDLHYRIGVVAIRVPPLRERRDDIPELIGDLLEELCADGGKPVPSVEPELMQYAADYFWPGNVGQLRDCLETMVCGGDARTLTVAHLRAALAESEGSFPGAPSSRKVATLARLERAAVVHALKVHEGNRTRAARSLGISVRTLQRKLQRWKT